MSTDNQPASKPGVLTTEFWSQIVAQIINLLVMLNLLSPADVPSIETTISKIIAAAVLICTNAIVVIHYVDGRFSLKKSGGTSSGPGIPSMAPACIAVVIALLCASSTNAAWPPKLDGLWNWTWRAKATKKIDELNVKTDDHAIKLDTHAQKITSFKADAPKQPPSTEAPQRLSIWEPALYKTPDPNIGIVQPLSGPSKGSPPER